MRITNNIIRQDALASLQTAMRQMSDAQSQVSTGLRLQKASDDPAAAAEVMRSSGSLRAIDQYRRNIQAVNARVSLEDQVLGQVSDTLTRAKELGLAQGSDTADASTRLVAKNEVDQLLQSAVALGNTRFGDAYLFGGDNATTQPFNGTTPPFTTATIAGDNTTEVGAGQLVAATHNGTEVFLDTGVLAALRDLSDALGNNDKAGIANSLTSLDKAFSAVQGLVGEIGARANRLDVASANLDAFEVTLKTHKSDLSEVDTEKAVTELMSRQTSYQAAMLATSRVLGLTLTDYLK